MHPTPLRVDEIGHILESDLGSILISMYTAARVMGKPLGGVYPIIVPPLFLNVLLYLYLQQGFKGKKY